MSLAFLLFPVTWFSITGGQSRGKGFEGMELDKVAGREAGDFHGAEIVFKDPIYLEILTAGNSLTFMSDGTEMETVGLDGSSAALEQVVACQAKK